MAEIQTHDLSGPDSWRRSKSAAVEKARSLGLDTDQSFADLVREIEQELYGQATDGTESIGDGDQ